MDWCSTRTTEGWVPISRGRNQCPAYEGEVREMPRQVTSCHPPSCRARDIHALASRCTSPLVILVHGSHGGHGARHMHAGALHACRGALKWPECSIGGTIAGINNGEQRCLGSFA